jgi:uncharacterized protein YggT (Ycf19 family)
MIIEELKNNLNSDFLFQKQIFGYFFQSLSIFLINAISYIYIIAKFFKVICYTKMTLEWFPMINPYSWPFSIFQSLTKPYFSFWSKIFPTIRFEKSSLEISGLIAIEALNSVIYLIVRLTHSLILILEQTEKNLLESE